ncbi:MAG TPA: hypothetical protein VHM27_11715, partial [Rhizomicrobium sp.]|nr:hypothetical protein [Rhizomicrobium sp.]
MASIAKPSGAPALWPYAALALLLLVLLGAILALNGGTFTYSLDDSYIHLAFSEQLAQGNFGLVAQQPASPSSSVLYPLLLLPLAGTALHPFQPLLWAAAAVCAALALWRYLLGHLVLEGLADGRLLSGIFALLAVVSLNHAGLAFSGMESALQITLSLATTIGLIELLFGQKLRWWLVLGIIAGPLIRYENLALSLPAILIVIAYGRWQTAALCALVIAAALGGYAAYCLSIGLPALPGSLLLKTGLGDPSVGLFWGIARQLRHLYEVAIGGRSDLPILMLMGLLVLNFAFCSPGPMRRRERVLIGSALFVMAVQFIFGGHGSLGRYDVYAW